MFHQPRTHEEWQSRRDYQNNLYRDDLALSLSKGSPPTMMQKRYIETLVAHCSDELSGQMAVAWAIETGRLKLSYSLNDDLEQIMGPNFGLTPSPELPAEDLNPKNERRYDQIIEEWQQDQADRHTAETALLIESYEPFYQALQTPVARAA